MIVRHVFYPRSVLQQLEAATPSLKQVVEDHLEALAQLAQVVPVERLAEVLKQDAKTGLFVWDSKDGRVLFGVSPATRSVIVHQVQPASRANTLVGDSASAAL